LYCFIANTTYLWAYKQEAININRNYGEKRGKAQNEEIRLLNTKSGTDNFKERRRAEGKLVEDVRQIRRNSQA